jgi:signal transduction histidine kinase
VTIRARLAATYAAALVMVLLVAGAILWWQLGDALKSSVHQTLLERATGAASALENAGQVGLQQGDTPLPGGDFVVMLDAAGHVLDASEGAPAGLSRLTVPGPSEVIWNGTTYAVDLVRMSDGTRIVAGSDMAEMRATLDRLGSTVLVVGGAAAVASLAAGWWLAGRALRPVAAITREAAQIGPADIDHRLPVPRQRDELHGLATTLNGMLDRVAEAVRRQRLFVAAASHDLRTPIAALQAELDLADDDRSSPGELRAAIRTAHADAVRLRELATALLDLAGAEPAGRVLVRAPVCCDDLVEAAFRRVEPLARERGTALQTVACGKVVRVDRVRVEQAITNLVMNAVAYAPAGSAVDVVAHVSPAASGMPAGDELLIDVLDRGPGVPEEFRGRLFEAFAHGAGPKHGSGLGLATAAAAIRAHRGAIGYAPRDGGGARFWVRVPA